VESEVPQRFKGKEALYEKLLKMFVKDLPDEWSGYEAVIADMENTKTFVHKIKGVAGNLDSKEIFEAAAQFESSLRNNTPDKELYNKFTASCDALKKSMQ